MEIFFSENTSETLCTLEGDEANHCIKVLRHKVGDEVNLIDGKGTMFRCQIVTILPKLVECKVLEKYDNWGGHPYSLIMAVCPTKNNDRYEWFAEKVTEFGVDCIVPIIGEHSERRVFKTDRLARIMLSASKQSLKAKIPEVTAPISIEDFIEEYKSDEQSLKLIAFCFEERKTSIKKALENFKGKSIIVMIGPEGDFSQKEVETAISSGFIPVHLGSSRLRTETAALSVAASVYLHYMED